MASLPPLFDGSVAITGLACRLPGAPNVEALWQLLLSGEDAVCEVPSERWDWRRFYDPAGARGKSRTKEAGFLSYWDYRNFDYRYFNLSAREAEEADPQQRLLLECSVEALEDSGLIWSGARGGVFIGGFALDMLTSSQDSSENQRINASTATSGTATMLSARISHLLNLNGPSLSVDTACSSSLVALHLATQSILNGECDFAITGGANVMLRPEMSVAMSQAGFLSSDGRSKSFDSRADGYGRGEGCGMVILQSTQRALERGDPIYAIIRGTGVNQDGNTQGIAVPNGHAQSTLMGETLARTRIAPDSIDYIEAHGTGTAVGDATECKSIADAYCASRSDKKPCLVGSIKSSIGHLEAGAGIAAVIKAALVLRHGLVPPQANLETLNPDIPFDAYKLKVAQKAPVQLEEGDSPLRAAVNSFGYGGTNAHAILERAPLLSDQKPPRTQPAQLMGRDLYIMPLSAQSDDALGELAGAYGTALSTLEEADSRLLASAAGLRRTSHTRRALVCARSMPDMKEALDKLSSGSTSGAVTKGRTVASPAKQDGLSFVFSGMGPQWWGMGRGLLESDDVFRSIARRCDEAFERVSGWSILAELLRETNSSRMSDTRIAQPANALVQIGLVECLASLGLRPSAVTGHSTGEIAAAYAAGMLDVERAMETAYKRSDIQSQLAGCGTMLALGCGEEQANDLIHDLGRQLSIAAINSPNAVTVAGEPLPLQALAERASAEGLFNRFLKVEIPYHSHLMERIKPDVMSRMNAAGAKAPKIPLYSTVTGERYVGKGFDADYWYSNIRHPVRFGDAVASMIADGSRHFLEIGPHPTLAQYVREAGVASSTSVSVTSTLSRDMPDEDAITSALGRLYTQGLELPWSTLLGVEGNVRLPSYPWQREPVWQSRPKLEQHIRGKIDHPLLGRKMLDHRGSFVSEVNKVRMEWLPDHVIDGAVVFPAAGFIEIGAALQALEYARQTFILERIVLERGLTISEGVEPLLETRLADDGYTLVISSSDPSQPDVAPTRHASMKLSTGTPQGPGKIDLPSMIAELSDVLTGEEIYKALAGQGLDYGPAFQLIRRIHRGSELSVTELSVPAMGQHQIHPCLLDACFQSVAASLDQGMASNAAYVPVGVRTLKFHGSLEQARYCLIQRVSKAGSETLLFDLQVANERGDLLIEISGFALGKIQTARSRASSSDEIGLYSFEWEELLFDAAATRADGKWLALMDAAGSCARYVGQLTNCGLEVTILPHGNRSDLPSELADGNWQGVIDFSPLDALWEDAGAHATGLLLDAVQACATSNIPLVLVTEKAQSLPWLANQIQAPQSSVIGALRVARTEYPEQSFCSIDIASRAGALPHNALHLALDQSADHHEMVLEGAKILTPLLTTGDPVLQEVVPEQRQLGASCAQLTLSKPGRFEGLVWHDEPLDDASDDATLLEIDAVSLNFKDVLKALGRLPKAAIENTFHGDGLGMEVSATVVKTGGQHHGFQTGDKIVSVVKHGLRTHATIPDGPMLNWVPSLDMLTPAENAAQPTVFITALYALENQARLQAGEDVLIHAAAGGVGQAAIQVAKHIGARVFATAGTQEKRQLLRDQGCDFVYDSRKIDFKEAILSQTDGRGVDVVLNSIAGETADTSLELVAPWGRFVEIGKADFVQNRPIASQFFNNSISYHAFDLDRMQKDKPGLFQRYLDIVWERLAAGVYTPLRTTVFGADEVQDAFRFLGQSKNIGKVAVELNKATEIESLASQSIDVSGEPNSAYLVTGGLGGFGLATAKWLAARGARKIVLASRRGHLSPNAREAEEALKALGADVAIQACDVSKADDVQKLVQSIQERNWSLKGVFHAAAVLDDGLIENQTSARIKHVMNAKALGALNLHNATRDLSLDYFVMYSSISAVVGTGGQFSYVAANSFLDALAYARRSQNLAGTSINWGPIADVGLAARDGSVLKLLEQNGFKALAPSNALDRLDKILNSNMPQMIVADIDWSLFLKRSDAAKNDSRFKQFGEVEGLSGLSPLMHELSQTSSEERVDLVAALLIEIVAEALKVPAESIEPETTLSDLGVDSLMATELQLALSEIGLSLSTMEIGQGLPIERLAMIALSKLSIGDETMPDIQSMAAE